MALAKNPLEQPITLIDKAITIAGNDFEAHTLEVTPEGYLTMVSAGNIGHESEENTTTDLLLAGETFTGEWEEITDYAIIKVFIYSDQIGAIGGLRFQQSPDQVIIDDELWEYTNGVVKMFTPNPISKWFRIIYTNGAVNQTVFNLSVIYSSVYAKPSSHRLGDNVTGNDDAELTKSVIAFRDENDDTYHNIGTQYALPTDGDSVYAHNIWEENSVVTDWVDLDSTGDPIITIPFTNLKTRIRNSTSNDPKILTVYFNRTINAQQIGMGADGGGDFSNVKFILLGSGGVTRTLLDDSANSTKYTSRNYAFPPQLFNAVQIEYHTTDVITVSNITIQKAQIVEAQLKGQQPDETLIAIGATNSGNLKVSDAENGLAIAKGDVLGTTFIHKFGNAPDFNTGDGFVTVWDGAEAGTTWELMNAVYSTTADIDTISSSNTGDTQDVSIQGLDASWEVVIQDATLNGQNKVTLSIPLIRVFRIKNEGTTDFAGHVLVYVDTTIVVGIPSDKTKIRALVHIDNNQTEMAIYTIPAGKTGYLRDWYASTSGAKKSSTHTIKLMARPFGKVFQLKHTANIADGGTSYIKHDYTEPEVFAEKTDIEIRVNTDQDSVAVAGGYDIVLIDD